MTNSGPARISHLEQKRHDAPLDALAHSVSLSWASRLIPQRRETLSLAGDDWRFQEDLSAFEWTVKTNRTSKRTFLDWKAFYDGFDAFSGSDLSSKVSSDVLVIALECTGDLVLIRDQR